MRVMTNRKLPTSLVVLDPGATVGVAITLVTEVKPTVYEVDTYTTTLAWPAQAEVIRDLINSGLVVAEDWRPGSGDALTGDTLPGPRCLGYIEGCLNEWQETHRLVLQQPAQGKQLQTSIKQQYQIEGREWPTTPHERDALGHLFYYLTGSD